MLPVAVAYSCYGIIVIHHGTSGFVDDIMFAHNWPGKGDMNRHILKVTHQE